MTWVCYPILLVVSTESVQCAFSFPGSLPLQFCGSGFCSRSFCSATLACAPSALVLLRFFPVVPACPTHPFFLCCMHIAAWLPSDCCNFLFQLLGMISGSKISPAPLLSSMRAISCAIELRPRNFPFQPGNIVIQLQNVVKKSHLAEGPLALVTFVFRFCLTNLLGLALLLQSFCLLLLVFNPYLVSVRGRRCIRLPIFLGYYPNSGNHLVVLVQILGHYCPSWALGLVVTVGGRPQIYANSNMMSNLVDIFESQRSSHR